MCQIWYNGFLMTRTKKRRLIVFVRPSGAACRLGSAAVLCLLCASPALSAAETRPAPAPSHHPSNLPHYPGRIERDGVSLEVEFFDPDLSMSVFGVDLLRHHVQPLTLLIQNRSRQAYTFQKAQVHPHYIPAERAAAYAYVNPVEAGVHTTTWLPKVVLKSVAGVVFPKNRRLSTPGPFMNEEIREHFIREEIPDAAIEPNGSLSGFVFIPPPTPGPPLRITLLNAQSQPSVVFDVPTTTP